MVVPARPPPVPWLFPLTVERRSGTVLSNVERRDRVAAERKSDLLQGTLDMLVLKALELGAMHGWGITERIEQGSKQVLQLNQGSLYPALYRLERQGLVTSGWKTTENNRRARYYSLTAAGRRQLTTERESWERMSHAVDLVLRMTPA
jgi:transcriptional regulator